MNYKRSRLDTYLVELVCDNCQKASMFPTGKVFYTSPLQHEHKCGECGYVTNVEKKYPVYDYELVEIKSL